MDGKSSYALSKSEIKFKFYCLNLNIDHQFDHLTDIAADFIIHDPEQAGQNFSPATNLSD